MKDIIFIYSSFLLIQITAAADSISASKIIGSAVLPRGFKQARLKRPKESLKVAGNIVHHPSNK